MRKKAQNLHEKIKFENTSKEEKRNRDKRIGFKSASMLASHKVTLMDYL